MSYFHADTLSRDRRVTPRLFAEEKKTGFDGFITYPTVEFTVIVIVSHEQQYLKREDSQAALWPQLSRNIFQGGGPICSPSWTVDVKYSASTRSIVRAG